MYREAISLDGVRHDAVARSRREERLRAALGLRLFWLGAALFGVGTWAGLGWLAWQGWQALT